MSSAFPSAGRREEGRLRSRNVMTVYTYCDLNHNFHDHQEGPGGGIRESVSGPAAAGERGGNVRKLRRGTGWTPRHQQSL